MYIVYMDYFNVSSRCDAVKMIYLHDVPDLIAWLNREGYNQPRCFTIRASATSYVERYILSDFATAYAACMFSKGVERFAKGGYIDYIARIAVEFEREIKHRAMRSVRIRKARLAMGEELPEGAGRG